MISIQKIAIRRFIELDYGKIYRKALYLMVILPWFAVKFPVKTNPVNDVFTNSPLWIVKNGAQLEPR
jgi:hypothetical protein